MPDARDFSPEYSTDSIWRGENMNRCLTDDLDTIEADIATLEVGKADVNHTHDDITVPEHNHDGIYAPVAHAHSEYVGADHTHTGFAATEHSHDNYALTSDIDALEERVGDTSVSSQISAAITSKADINHGHDEYALTSHLHTDVYAPVLHAHPESAAAVHTHDEYALASDVTSLEEKVGDTSVSVQIAAVLPTKADTVHYHDQYAHVEHGHNNYAHVLHSHADYASLVHSHSNYSENGHGHLYSEILGVPTIPTALPAAGGDSDTVDGKHASDFATAYAVAMLQEQVGDTSVSAQIAMAVETKADVEHTHAIEDIPHLRQELNAKYEKPINGIPAEDLTFDIQSALDKANTSVQSLAGYATTSYVDAKVADLIDSAPEALNTLNELAGSLGQDPNFAATVLTQIGGKVDKVDGKELSTNDYTTAEKDKLAGIAVGANQTIVDSELSATSTNPVENKVVNEALTELSGLVGDTAVSTQITNAIAENAYNLPSAGVVLGGVKTGGDVTIFDGVISVNDDSHNHVIANVDGLQAALDGKSASNHTHDGYVNQNAFSNIQVGTTTIAADTVTDTLTIVAGNNITLTPDATNDKITIVATDTVYTHPNSGVVAGTYNSVTVNAAGHIIDGGNPTTLAGYGITDAATKAEVETLSSLVGDTAVSAQIAGALDNCVVDMSVSGKVITYTKNDGTTGTITTQDTDTTYYAATQSAQGLMSADDKKKLDGISAGAKSFSTTKSKSITETGWYRVATSAASINNCLGTFRLNAARSSYHTSALITAGTNYGRHAKIGVLHYGSYTGNSMPQARIVYTTTYGGNYAYLELYIEASTDKANVLTVEMSNDAGWSLVDIVAGSVPSGYTTVEADLTDKAWSNVTATATELNRMSGVTGNVQTQLNGKLNKSGDTMTGNLIINTGSTSALGLQAPNNSAGEEAYARVYKNASATADYGLQLRDYAHGDNLTSDSCALIVSNNKTNVADKLVFAEQKNGVSTSYKVYGEHNKPTLSTLGVTATAAELNKLDGVTATTAELNYVDGVTSNIQTQLNNKAASSHTHSGYAASNHTHNYAEADHTHDYAASNHTHSGYATTSHSHSGYAASSHNHSASNITSGTLPISRGGTGATSATSAVTNLGIADYIVAQGTSGIWTWRKWNSGVSECWGSTTVSSQIDCTTQRANAVYTDDTFKGVNAALPSGLFTSVTFATANARTNGYSIAQVSGVSTTLLTYRMWCPYPTLLANGAVMEFQVKGRWK